MLPPCGSQAHVAKHMAATARGAGEDAQGSLINHVHVMPEHDYGQLSPSFVQQKQRSTSSSSEWCAHIRPTSGRACARIVRTAVVVSLSPYIPSYSLAAIPHPCRPAPRPPLSAVQTYAAATLPPAPTLRCPPCLAMLCHTTPCPATACATVPLAPGLPSHPRPPLRMPCHAMA